MFIFSVIFLLSLGFICFLGLYLRQKKQIQQLTINIQSKAISHSNRLLTDPTQGSSLSALIAEINHLFDEIQETQLTASQEKARFEQALHNITHDIRTPLTIASGYTQTLLSADNFEKADLEKIKLNLDQVSERLQILLDYQNLLEDTEKVNLERIDLGLGLKENLLNYFDALSEARFELDFEIEERLFVTLDSQFFNRIVQNALGNVLKHGKGRLSIQLARHKDRVQLSFKNQSQQPIHNLEKLTHRFYTENLSHIENSSGLGLYIIEELVKRTDGNLSLAYEEPNFTLSLGWKIKKEAD
ncbi:MAG: HAMP domain-containing histidine kinase [Streptococcaceae bacterium]|jgi:signal transduction histidine kinase|nr:HAMP domain-containing histidine kinase [Streptococcaceae bacterium]